jgi:methylenetetrahydrofolate reductase (NADPH)
MDSQKQFTPTYSFEFFPPKTEEGKEKLKVVREKLSALKPKYFSVTFGAGGSTQQGTLETVVDIQKSGTSAAPHISCIGTNKETINQLLDTYKSNDIRHLVCLRGDLPSGAGNVSGGDFNYANELVAYIRKQYNNDFYIEVAAYPEYHPQASSPSADIDNFKRKVEAGADSALTQYFFNPDAYYNFINECEKRSINIPVVPGIMPITNYTQLSRFSEMCGAEIPRWIRKRLIEFGDDRDSIRAFGEEVVSNMCRKLLDAGAPGLHFYTLNQSQATINIWNNLGL